MSGPTLLVVAKSPVAGEAKTRLGTALTPAQAADVAAAALLDTLAAVQATPARRRVVAFTGDLSGAARRTQLEQALRAFVVVPQRGSDFAARLAAAHRDAANLDDGAGGVLQIGMDTPQIQPALLAEAGARLADPETDAVLGPAADGGWWALGVRRPELADVLRAVPMSRADTGEQTLRALQGAGARVQLLEVLSDVDTPDDLTTVAAAAPGTRFAAAVAELSAPVGGR